MDSSSDTAPTDETVIKVSDISKTFRLPHERSASVKSALINFRRRGFERQKTLTDISFEVKKGEFFGIVGRNGSGKSTMLKLLAGIYTPDKGTIDIRGKLTPFIELGVGFNPELTGRENVFLNGALLGFNRREMEAMYGDIVEFAELERFMDQKLKNYSSGMQVRLAFSIAIRVQSDILLIDEVLAVGDERFQNKCLKVFQELKESGTTIILVSHDMASVKRFCDRAVVIHDGHLVYEGDANKAASEYVKLNFPETVAASSGRNKFDKQQDKITVRLKNVNGKPKSNGVVFSHGDKLTFDISWQSKAAARNVGIALYNEAGQYVFGANTILEKQEIKGNSIEYSLTLNVGDGDYYIQVGVFGKTDAEKVYFLEKGYEFKVINDEAWQGMTHLPHEWRT